MKIQCVDVAAKTGRMYIASLGPQPVLYESVHEVEEAVGEALLRDPAKWREVIIRKKATGSTKIAPKKAEVIDSSIPDLDPDLIK